MKTYQEVTSGCEEQNKGLKEQDLQKTSRVIARSTMEDAKV